MKAVLFVVVLFAAAISLSAQPANTVTVQIVFVNETAKNEPCNQTPTTIVVIGTTAYHCLEKKLTSHGEAEKNSAAVVQLTVGQRIRWESDRPFTVARLERHGTLAPGTPNDPFSGNVFTNKPANAVTSGTVVNLEGNVQQRYKVSFLFKAGLVDPDFNCSM